MADTLQPNTTPIISAPHKPESMNNTPAVTGQGASDTDKEKLPVSQDAAQSGTISGNKRRKMERIKRRIAARRQARMIKKFAADFGQIQSSIPVMLQRQKMGLEKRHEQRQEQRRKNTESQRILTYNADKWVKALWKDIEM